MINETALIGNIPTQITNNLYVNNIYASWIVSYTDGLQFLLIMILFGIIGSLMWKLKKVNGYE